MYCTTTCTPRAVRYLPVYITLLCAANKQCCSTCCPAYFSSFHSGDPSSGCTSCTVHTHTHTLHTLATGHPLSLPNCCPIQLTRHPLPYPKPNLVLLLSFHCVHCVQAKGYNFSFFLHRFPLEIFKNQTIFQIFVGRREGEAVAAVLKTFFQIFS